MKALYGPIVWPEELERELTKVEGFEDVWLLDTLLSHIDRDFGGKRVYVEVTTEDHTGWDHE